MAKTKKRQVSRGNRLSETQRQVTTSAPAAAKASNKASSPNRPALSNEFNPDYTFVKQDLKKIGIMAASFISVLVILSFFLR